MSEAAASTHRPLNASDTKTLLLAALGGALEFYDFIIFVFFTAVIGALFFPPDMPEWLRQFQTFGIFAAGYLARPLGGIVMAHFGDRLGRKRMFTLSVFLMAIPTLGIGLLPTYETLGLWAPLLLLGLRILQGAAIGGEIPGAWVFVSEHVPANRIGLACGTLTAGLTFGILMGSLTATAINTVYPPEEVRAWAWRMPFLLGGVFGFIAVWLRQWLHETPVFEELRARKALAQELPLKTVLRGHYGAVFLSLLITWVLTAAIIVVILMTPALMQKLHGLTPAVTLQANVLATLMLTIGCVLAGLACDRYGAPRALAIGCVGLFVATYALYLGVAGDASLLLPLYALAGLTVGVVGAVPSIIVRLFPAPVRFTGLSFSYNLAYAVFGGLTPLLISLAVRHTPLAPAHYVGALAVLGVCCGVYLLRRGISGSNPDAAQRNPGLSAG